MSNIQTRGEKCEQKLTIEFLSLLEYYYLELLSHFSNAGCNVYTIDGELPDDEIVAQVQHILQRQPQPRPPHLAWITDLDEPTCPPTPLVSPAMSEKESEDLAGEKLEASNSTQCGEGRFLEQNKPVSSPFAQEEKRQQRFWRILKTLYKSTLWKNFSKQSPHIVITGNIGAGKTTLLDNLYAQGIVRSKSPEVARCDEDLLAKYYEDKSTWSYEFQ